MTHDPTVSVIVVSHGRPTHLKRCLTSLRQLQYSRFEIIVVADEAGLDAVATLTFAAAIKTATQPEANISKARNDGIALAAGEFCAFLDDDAVAEPFWLDHLVAAGHDFVTGTVIGRNGFSVQWGRMAVSRTSQDWHLRPNEDLPPGSVLKLHGCNFMGRRDHLIALSGFDETLRFFLDDADLSLRVAAAGREAHFVPGARVHHAFAASARRRAARVPTDLYEIAASQADFLSKHSNRAELDTHISRFREHQTLRLSRLRRRRQMTARAQRSVLESLEAGLNEGLERPTGELRTGFDRPPGFLSGAALGPTPLNVISSSGWSPADLREQAAVLALQGARVLAFCLKPTPHRHRRFFDDQGFWIQVGGLYGASDRSQAGIQTWRFQDRIAAETATFGLSPDTA